jgi:hypothetical protein
MILTEYNILQLISISINITAAKKYSMMLFISFGTQCDSKHYIYKKESLVTVYWFTCGAFREPLQPAARLAARQGAAIDVRQEIFGKVLAVQPAAAEGQRDHWLYWPEAQFIVPDWGIKSTMA